MVAAHLQPCVASSEEFARVADVLMAAWGDGRPPASDPAALQAVTTLADALSVHGAIVASPHAARLGGVAGYKLGWKGAFPEQHALHGPLFASGLFQHGMSVSLAEHKIFSAEAEFGLVFGKALAARSEAYSEEEVWEAVDHVELCIELCSCRQWQTSNRLHYVADALLSGCVVRGPSIGKPTSPSKLPEVSVRLLVGGKEMSSGNATSNPYDAPLASVAFLVNDLCVARRVPICAGDLVISGHCCQVAFADRPCPPHTVGGTPLAAWKAGDVIRAEFEGLGAVQAELRD